MKETTDIPNKAQDNQLTSRAPQTKQGKKEGGKKIIICLPSVSLVSKQVAKHTCGSKVDMIDNPSEQQQHGTN